MTEFIQKYASDCSYLIGAIEGALISQENGILTAQQTTEQIRFLLHEAGKKQDALKITCKPSKGEL